MGLDKPLVVQYFVWLGKALRGDLGMSLREQRPVLTAVLERVSATLQLGLSAFVFSTVLGVLLAVLAAVKRATIWDYIGRTFALFGQALPPFWVGIVFILIYAVQLHWLPSGQRGGIRHFILPAVPLRLSAAAHSARRRHRPAGSGVPHGKMTPRLALVHVHVRTRTPPIPVQNGFLLATRSARRSSRRPKPTGSCSHRGARSRPPLRR